MRLVNGFNVYDKGEKPSLPKGAPSIPEHIISKFGWKLVNFQNKKCWEAMNEDEHKEIVSKVTGRNPEEITYSCSAVGNTCYGDCFAQDSFCVTIVTSGNVFCMCIGLLSEEE